MSPPKKKKKFLTYLDLSVYAFCKAPYSVIILMPFLNIYMSVTTNYNYEKAFLKNFLFALVPTDSEIFGVGTSASVSFLNFQTFQMSSQGLVNTSSVAALLQYQVSLVPVTFISKFVRLLPKLSNFFSFGQCVAKVLRTCPNILSS